MRGFLARRFNTMIRPGGYEGRKERKMYTAQDAKRECKELLNEGYGFSGVRIFLNDLARSKDITWEENLQIMVELLSEGIDCSIATF